MKEQQKSKPKNRHPSGFRGPSPDVGKATQFKPGKSGNPGGRPKHDFAAEIAHYAFEKNPQKVAEAFYKALLKASPKVFTALGERAYGKPPQPVELKNPEGEVFRVVVEHIGGNTNKASA